MSDEKKLGPGGGVLPAYGQTWTPPQPAFDPVERPGKVLPTDRTREAVQPQAPWPAQQHSPRVANPISPEYPMIPAHDDGDDE